MGIKPKGPLFLLRETEALLCAHSKACNRRPLCGEVHLLTTNSLKEDYFLYLVSYKIKTGFDAHTLFCPVDSKFFSLKKGAYFFENSAGCKYTDVCIRPFLCPRKKALAICVQSHNCSSSSVMLLFISRHVWRGNSEIIVAFLLTSNFLDLENPSSKILRPSNYTCPSCMTWSD